MEQSDSTTSNLEPCFLGAVDKVKNFGNLIFIVISHCAGREHELDVDHVYAISAYVFILGSMDVLQIDYTLLQKSFR